LAKKGRKIRRYCGRFYGWKTGLNKAVPFSDKPF
jgi:hypothetical protein